METPLDKKPWKEVLDLLRRREVPDDQIGHAIVLVGKPHDESRAQAAKEVVASYLKHSNPWARHEATWFLGCWYRLKEYEPLIQNAFINDPDEENRSYAARCLAGLAEGSQNKDLLKTLASVTRSPGEPKAVRLSAYDAMQVVFNGKSALRSLGSDFGLGKLDRIDWQWVEKFAE
jgi:hypothetical protein